MEFSDAHNDAMTELLNIGVGKAAEVLNQMIDSHVSLSVPATKIMKLDDLLSQFNVGIDERLASVCLEFDGGFSGATSLVFPTPCAANLVEALTGELGAGTDQIDSMRVSVLIEVGNILINGVMGSIANMLGTHITYRVPSYCEGTIRELIQEADSGKEQQVILAKTQMVIQNFQIEGDVILWLEVDTFTELITSLLSTA